MIKFKNKMLIHASRKRVFDFLGNFENLPMWNYYISSVKKKNPELTGKGSIYRQTRKHDEQIFRIEQYEPNLRITVKTLEEKGWKDCPVIILLCSHETHKGS